MTNFLKLPTWDDDGHIHTVVETPRGSTCKLDFDPDLGVFTLAKPLMAGLSYPFDWGFIPSTKAPDGDPLDVLIIHDARTYPGVVLKCRPVGVLEVEQTSGAKRERNDRIFAVPDRSPLETDLKDIRNLPSRPQGARGVLSRHQRSREQGPEIPWLARPEPRCQDDQAPVDLAGIDAEGRCADGEQSASGLRPAHDAARRQSHRLRPYARRLTASRPWSSP
jgi:inorganic pyrophosphatase